VQPRKDVSDSADALLRTFFGMFDVSTLGMCAVNYEQASSRFYFLVSHLNRCLKYILARGAEMGLLKNTVWSQTDVAALIKSQYVERNL
jgi:hypothetical protein